MDEMDFAKDRIEVLRVNNGWLVNVGASWEQGGACAQTFVARKAGELADLIHVWAARQATNTDKADK